jgi:hypothetical protein
MKQIAPSTECLILVETHHLTAEQPTAKMRTGCLILVETLDSRLAEFASIADAGKAALCLLRSLLSNMGFVQEHLTETQADNQGAACKWRPHNSQHVERDTLT